MPMRVGDEARNDIDYEVGCTWDLQVCPILEMFLR